MKHVHNYASIGVLGPRFLVRALASARWFNQKGFSVFVESPVPKREAKRRDFPARATFDRNTIYFYLGQKNVGSLK